jgi:hypothetical protein
MKDDKAYSNFKKTVYSDTIKILRPGHHLQNYSTYSPLITIPSFVHNSNGSPEMIQ